MKAIVCLALLLAAPAALAAAETGRAHLGYFDPARPMDQGGRPGSFKFVGGGWGHGVGMCQMGARGLAAAGKNCLAILTHYFTGTELARLYD